MTASPQSFSINAGGAVTGHYNGEHGNGHGFVRRANGTLISFDPPGSFDTSPNSINAKGTITGTYSDGHGAHGFLRRPGGEIVSFDVSGSLATGAVSINDTGAITGAYMIANGRAFGSVRDPHGKFTSFDPSPNTFPTSINNEGAITGFYLDINSNFSHFFLRSPEGTITSFVPPFCQTFASGSGPLSINDEGVISGNCSLANGSNVGWVRFP
jgi:hypothetical protein